MPLGFEGCCQTIEFVLAPALKRLDLLERLGNILILLLHVVFVRNFVVQTINTKHLGAILVCHVVVNEFLILPNFFVAKHCTNFQKSALCDLCVVFLCS